jgi:hypothetical protein
LELQIGFRFDGNVQRLTSDVTDQGARIDEREPGQKRFYIKWHQCDFSPSHEFFPAQSSPNAHGAFSDDAQSTWALWEGES